METENNNIKKIIDNTVSCTINELSKRKMIRNKSNTFRKTEQLLYNYNNFIEVIKRKEEEIIEIQEHGTKNKSKSITRFSNTSQYENKTEDEKKEEMIECIKDSINNTKRLVSKIDMAIGDVREDDYNRIINYKYFKGKTLEEIASIYQKDISTIARNKNRLINRMKVFLFSDEVIDEIMDNVK